MVCAAPTVSSASFQRSRKRCCWRWTTAGTSGSARLGEFAQMAGAFPQHRGQARAFALARLAQALYASPGRLQRRLVELFSALRAFAPDQHLVHRQRRCFGQPALNRAFQMRQPIHLLGLWQRHGTLAFGSCGQAQFDLAAPERSAEQVAQRRLERAQFIGKAKAQVQETAVHGSQFDAHRAGSLAGLARCRWLRTSSRVVCGNGGRGGAGVAGHTVDCH